ncbi:hypothetical protein [Halegenticoccus tardaugens]|uniref:hypothetical protein n=1 Tax=Halegenticoccus tardaugens TaxID=2071624 RepID=UPI00100C1DAE|nr:hypothetical protein [Halegenticoccus tardaugens]
MTEIGDDQTTSESTTRLEIGQVCRTTEVAHLREENAHLEQAREENAILTRKLARLSEEFDRLSDEYDQVEATLALERASKNEQCDEEAAGGLFRGDGKPREYVRVEELFD